ncbi:NAD-dependent epimerase/dehydratase family protein [Helicobacter brantae]|uniref:NAD-dependent epimerase/dehydratase domain-containing protein n=1 Tax=Helicobacter brantae TaxID=375927 RepID=A0A3D8J4L5_9HELI|nr:NAD-dependent epimerase/dehydratase family protein [Helicobacter brantae]RDU72156.1 hypothetical protein CQA58_00695 [Helicobacter brantae]
MELYFSHIEENIDIDLENWAKLNKKNIVLTGSTGMIGKFLTDTLFLLQMRYSIDFHLIILVSNSDFFIKRFPYFCSNNNVSVYQVDLLNLKELFKILSSFEIHYIIHAASPADPKSVALSPTSVIRYNTQIVENLLRICTKKKSLLIFLSSSEVYGKVCKKKPIQETDLGFIDVCSINGCYAQSKRMAETICAAYNYEYNTDFVSLRLPRTFGSTIRDNDPRALSSFLYQSAHGQNIQLKSHGNQILSFLYVGDCIRSIAFAMFVFKKNQTYNISNPEILTLWDFCSMVCSLSPHDINIEKYSDKDFFDNIASKVEYSVLETSKALSMGFKTHYSILDGINISLRLLQRS